MDDPGPLWSGLILFILVVVNGLFSAGEIAIVTMNDNRLRELAEDGDKRAKTIVGMVGKPSGFLATVRTGVTLCAMLAAALTAGWLAPLIVSALPIAANHVAQAAAALLLTLALCFFVLVFGDMVPKRLAVQKPEKSALRYARILRFLSWLVSPLVFLASKTANCIVRLFGIDPHKERESVTEEEIRMMVDVGNEKGVIEQSQREMINNIFEFDDITAGEIMTHRIDVCGVETDANISEVAELSIREGYSRIPVYENDIDNIIGIIHVKDLLSLVCMNDAQGVSITDFIRPVLFVPESNRCKELFKEFTEKKVQMAVVIDEYGGTAGIVTMEDILEAIVGNIQDEYDDEEEEIRQTGETTYVLDGSADLEDVFELFGLELPEDTDYDTIGGLIIDLLGRIPDDGETPHVQYENVVFKVTLVEDRRVAELTAELLPVTGDGQEEQPQPASSAKAGRK